MCLSCLFLGSVRAPHFKALNNLGFRYHKVCFYQYVPFRTAHWRQCGPLLRAGLFSGDPLEVFLAPILHPSGSKWMFDYSEWCLGLVIVLYSALPGKRWLNCGSYLGYCFFIVTILFFSLLFLSYRSTVVYCTALLFGVIFPVIASRFVLLYCKTSRIKDLRKHKLTQLQASF